ncbi:hypothetical protein [Terribacillus saccharophilus]|uniref:hypothetical protein n=1 Tax=Terribacillus saccharophilus TaxID=361277 RepID=UPI000BA6288F|nr:hypothetical protein [Terribacillus saccharophilus]PAF18974.1 hypothetical protein CHH51_04545 [Terribacillus saccharophilus]
MSLEMKPEIKVALEKIKFVDRYKLLSGKYQNNSNDVDDKLERYDIEDVKAIIKKLGYDAEFDKKEKFFKVGVLDESPNYKIWFNIILEYGMTEFIWVVYHHDEVRLGSPWSVYSRFLVDPKERIKKPVYRSYEELEQILKEAFSMYDDFKGELINLYNEQ